MENLKIGDVMFSKEHYTNVTVEGFTSNNPDFVDVSWGKLFKQTIHISTLSKEMSYGAKAVGLTFNHGEGEIFNQVNAAKIICAKAIDQMNDLKNKSESGEYKALCTIAIRDLQKAQMMMVKAITWKD